MKVARGRALWFNTDEEGGYTVISEGSTILRGPKELHLMDQRCQAGLKSMHCGKASATVFCQSLST